MQKSKPVLTLSAALLFFFSSRLSVDFKCEDFIALFPPFACLPNNKLGSGASGQAFLIANGDNKRVVKASSYVEGRSEREFETMNKFDHPNVLKAFNSIIDKDQYYMALEYGELGTLEAHTAAHPELFKDTEKAIYLFSKLVDAVAHVHSKKVVHADIKPENVIITANWEPKLIDFDVSVPLNGKQTFRGTLPYADPELMLQEGDQEYVFTFDEGNDVYALGVLLYWLTQGGSLPFTAKTRSSMHEQHVLGDFKLKAGTPVGIAQLIHGCLQRLKRDRIRLDTLQSYLAGIESVADLKRFKEEVTLNNKGRFPYSLWLAQHGPVSLWEEFAEMIFVFALAFILIPVIVYCLKRKMESHFANQQLRLNQPLNVNQPNGGPEVAVQA